MKMSGYVVKKKGVLLPRSIIEQLGMKEGDRLKFETKNEWIRVVKVKPKKIERNKLTNAIENFTGDLKKIMPYMREAEEGLIEGFVRHVSTER
ncbi:MAG: AbrB/MazE/SpoVT family DNA-binding domain-containing protein [Euryarchaeota archaeon]|nr:AbrB/MazE/SpoVT family DNA-binding domain-containing protein [Euryarchaeota archaeon]